MKNLSIAGLIVIAVSAAAAAEAADKVDITVAEMTAVLTNPEFLQQVRKSASKAVDGIDGISRGEPGDYWVSSSHCKIRVKVKSHVDSKSGKVIVDSVKPDLLETCE
jgi:hypothetical protein